MRGTASARAWQLVLSHIELRLLDGSLSPGDHLPPERTLAADLGVGRSSVREAVRVLEVLGLIRTQTGSGPSSGAVVVARPGGGMSQLLRLQVAATGFRVSDIVATRLVLETAVAARLATMDYPDLTRAHELLAAMDTELSPQEFLALDAAFHLAMADAAGNEVIAAMMAGLRDSIESYVLAGVATVPSWHETVARLRNEHRGIVDAIRRGEAAEASDRIRTHISGYYAETAVTPTPARPKRDD